MRKPLHPSSRSTVFCGVSSVLHTSDNSSSVFPIKIEVGIHVDARYLGYFTNSKLMTNSLQFHLQCFLRKLRFVFLITNRHPAAQTGPRSRPPKMDHTLLSSLALRRMGKPCRAYHLMPYTRSKYTHQIGTDVCAESSEPLSFMFTHFLCQIMQTLIMLGLRDRAVFQKTIEQRLLPQEQLMAFLLI